MAKRDEVRQRIRPGSELPRRAPLVPSPFPWWPIETPEGGQELIRPILSDRSVVMHTHYLPSKKRKVLCTMPIMGRCEIHDDVGLDVYCYLVVWSSPRQSNAIIGVPRHAALKCEAIATDQPLFGRELRLKRKGLSKFGPLTAYIPSYVSLDLADDRLVPWTQLQAHLLHLWQITLVEDAYAGMTDAEIAENLQRDGRKALTEKRSKQ
jgi:hypothetical protein